MQTPIITAAAFFLQRGAIDEAIADWEMALEMQPNDADAHTSLGNALLQKGSLREAIAHYVTALGLAPEDPHSRNNVAWILATASDSSIRDGARAVGFAQEGVQLSGGRELFLRTLSQLPMRRVARVSEAIAVAKQAAAIATMQAKPDMAKRLRERPCLFQRKCPHFEPPPGN